MNLLKNIRMTARNKLLLVLALFLILATLLSIGRLALFYRGFYRPPTIPEIAESPVAPIGYQPFEDKPIEGNGHVVIDLSHNNNLAINDLAPLRDRLEARGATIETFDGADTSLEDLLQRTTALLVIAPAERYTVSEGEAIVDFVEDGGLLLMAADPTRPVQEEEEEEDAYVPLDAIFFPTSAVPAINSLAGGFGVVYFDDYLYDLEDNAGNYRNVKFTDFDIHPLTEGIDTVVLFAAHSLRSDGLSLVVGDEHTFSPVRSGETDLAAATLTADGHVLALGDITFLTAPYHTIEDNDRFLSNIADWLAVDRRARDELEDFPYLFDRPVDLVQASGDFLDPQLVAHSDEWRAFFDQAGLDLHLRAEADPDHDVLFIGTFDDLDLVQEYLDEAGVTVNVTAEEEEEGKDEEEAGEEEEEAAAEEGAEEAVEETTEATPTPEPAEEGEEEEEKEEGQLGTIEIEALGTIGVQGTTLFVVDRGDDRVAVVVLVEESEQTVDAMERLIGGDFSGCVAADTATLCSTGEAQEGLETEETEEKPAEDGEAEPAVGGGRILIIANDSGPEGARTSAPEFEAILSASYEVTVWSIKDDGVPVSGDVSGYDAYILDSGDYASDFESIEALTALEEVEGGIMLVGAQPFPLLGIEYEPINDLQVADVSHPLAAGFDADQILSLSASESGVPAAIIADAEIGEDVTIVLTRGPDSPEAGTPALLAAVSADENISRVVLAAFAFYRLPEEAQRTLALNAVQWLMGSGD